MYKYTRWNTLFVSVKSISWSPTLKISWKCAHLLWRMWNKLGRGNSYWGDNKATLSLTHQDQSVPLEVHPIRIVDHLQGHNSQSERHLRPWLMTLHQIQTSVVFTHKIRTIRYKHRKIYAFSTVNHTLRPAVNMFSLKIQILIKFAVPFVLTMPVIWRHLLDVNVNTPQYSRTGLL